MARKLLFLVILSITSSVLSQKNDGQLHSSVKRIKLLQDTEKSLLSYFQEYTKELYLTWQKVDSAVREMRAENQRALLDPEGYLSNPLNAFPLIRRMHIDSQLWYNFIQKPLGQELSYHLEMLELYLPDEQNFKQSMSDVWRLQVIHNLQPLDLAKGLLNGVQHNWRLTASDCLAIGEELHRQEEYRLADGWLRAALKLSQNEESASNVPQLNQAKLFDLLAEIILRLGGKTSEALETWQKALSIEPHNSDILHKISLLASLLNLDTVEKSNHEDESYLSSDNDCHQEINDRYSKFHCLYNTTTNPFLKLAPLKMEIISMDPYVVVYNDVISDHEIANLRKLAVPTPSRASIQITDVDIYVKNEESISRLVWFSENATPILSKINRHLKYMTGQHGSPAEMRDERKASVLFFLNDADSSETREVFWRNNSNTPKKGKALFFYNIDKSGNIHDRLLHVACPALVGVK